LGELGGNLLPLEIDHMAFTSTIAAMYLTEIVALKAKRASAKCTIETKHWFR